MNVFIDCGTHCGQGLRHFIDRFKIDKSWSVHTFEANPVTYKIYVENHHQQNDYVMHYNVALSNFDGFTTINIETPPGEGDTGQASSIVSLEKWNPWGGELRKNFINSAKVPCWSLSRFIKENFTKEDKIVIKMDIEGSEYDVLEQMIEDGTIEWVDHISVEYHSRFFINAEEIIEREKKIKSKIKTEGWV
jgi:FkbM family methyltransferase